MLSWCTDLSLMVSLTDAMIWNRAVEPVDMDDVSNMGVVWRMC